MNETERLLQILIETIHERHDIPPRPVTYGEIEPPFEIQVAAHLITGWAIHQQSGRNTDADAGAEDVWDGGGLWVAPTAPRVHNLVSDDAKDTASDGVGARLVRLRGLDRKFILTNETVPLAGLTPVATRQEYCMIYSMEVVGKVGSELNNAGTITATAVTDGTITAQINPGNNDTLMAIFQVPLNADAYVTKWDTALLKAGGATKRADFQLLTSEFGGGFAVRDTASLSSDGTSADHHHHDVAMRVHPGGFIKISSIASAVDQDVSGGFDLFLEFHDEEDHDVD